MPIILKVQIQAGKLSHLFSLWHKNVPNQTFLMHCSEKYSMYRCSNRNDGDTISLSKRLYYTKKSSKNSHHCFTWIFSYLNPTSISQFNFLRHFSLQLSTLLCSCIINVDDLYLFSESIEHLLLHSSFLWPSVLVY